MSKNLKRSISCEEDSDNEETTAEKQAKMEHNKNSIMILNELCQKTSQTPKYDELNPDDPEIPFYLKAHEKKFWMRCSALGKSGIDGGPTKKSAKHAAAVIVCRKLNGGSDDSDSDGNPQDFIKKDYVTELLNFCVLKNYHKPQFECVDSYGPSHDPCFTFECRLNSIVRTATANTKTQSKQMAAKEVLDIVKSFLPDIEKKVAVINEENLVKEESYKKITTYLKAKELGKVDGMGSTLSDRSNFFLNHPNDDFIKALKIILEKKLDTDTKYEQLVEELKRMWSCKVEDYFETGMQQFECLVDFEQFTVSLVATKSELKKEVVNYFSEMLNIPCH